MMRRTIFGLACLLFAVALSAPEARASNHDERNRVRGEVLKMDGDRMWIKSDQGQQIEVDLSRLPKDSRRSLDRGDFVTVRGEPTGGDPQKPTKFEARSISGRDVSGDVDGRRQIRGEVVRVEGNRMWLMADAGQQVEVDISRVAGDSRRSLNRGDRLIVVGEPKAGDPQKPTKFEAHGIRGKDVVDDPAGRNQGDRYQANRYPGDSGRLRGAVASVDGNLAWVDPGSGGRQVQVDISRLSDSEQRALKRGGEFVFIGERKGEQFVAREVRDR
jgi:hypothetical protein